MSESIASVLIVEDHEDAGLALQKVCETLFSGAEIKIARTLKGAQELVAGQHFDLALIDLGLPDGSGIDLIASIKSGQVNGDTRCVVTTIFDDDEHLLFALRAGADGYLIKGHTPAELKVYLSDAVSGKLALSASVAQSILKFFREEQAEHEQQLAGEEEAFEVLTEREAEVLGLIAKGRKVKEVADVLTISVNTVAHHIKSIYSKLNVHNRAEATAMALNLNLLSPD